MIGVEVVHRSSRVGSDVAEVPDQACWFFCQKENIRSHRLQEPSVANFVDGDAGSDRIAGQAITPVCRESQVSLYEWIRPDSAVKLAEGNTSPLQIVGALKIVFDLDVHDDGAGLLNLPDPS